MQWTTKSIAPHNFTASPNTVSIEAPAVTSQWPSTCAPDSCASGRTRFSSASPWNVNASSAPAAWAALAMPHAIERLFATPKTTPRIPRITPAVAPTERVRSIKASLRLAVEGEYYAAPAPGYPLTSPDTHGKDKGFGQSSQNV